jgi:hypothetical protein
VGLPWIFQERRSEKVEIGSSNCDAVQSRSSIKQPVPGDERHAVEQAVEGRDIVVLLAREHLTFDQAIGVAASFEMPARGALARVSVSQSRNGRPQVN